MLLCLLPQEYVDNPLYVEQVQVVDEAAKSANQPAADNKVRHQFVTLNVFISNNRIYSKSPNTLQLFNN